MPSQSSAIPEGDNPEGCSYRELQGEGKVMVNGSLGRYGKVHMDPLGGTGRCTWIPWGVREGAHGSQSAHGVVLWIGSGSDRQAHLHHASLSSMPAPTSLQAILLDEPSYLPPVGLDNHVRARQ